MKKIMLFCLLMVAISSPAYCGQTSRIQLNDGSVINAEVISFQNGTYTLRTGSLGEFKVDATKVQKIESVNTYAPPASFGPSSGSGANISYEVEKLKTKMAGDPEITSIVTGLVSDPQFQEIAKDPSIVNAANSGDLQSLLSNEKFMGLVNNPKIKEIQEKLKK